MAARHRSRHDRRLGRRLAFLRAALSPATAMSDGGGAVTKEDMQRMLSEGTLTWEQLVEFVAEWMQNNHEIPDRAVSLVVKQWREESSELADEEGQ